MKKAFAILLAITLIFSVFTLTSCSSAQSKLSSTEKAIFDVLVLRIENDFKNPTSVKILNITKMGKLANGSAYARIELQGTNSYGGTVTESYYVNTAATGKYRFIETDTYLAEYYNAVVGGNESFPVYEYLFNDVSTDIDLDNDIEKKFNDALSEYWKDKGLSS